MHFSYGLPVSTQKKDSRRASLAGIDRQIALFRDPVIPARPGILLLATITLNGYEDNISGCHTREGRRLGYGTTAYFIPLPFGKQGKNRREVL